MKLVCRDISTQSDRQSKLNDIRCKVLNRKPTPFANAAQLRCSSNVEEKIDET